MTSNPFFVLLIFWTTNTFVTGSYQSLFTADTKPDILQRLTDLERRVTKQQAEIDALQSKNVALHELNLDITEEIDSLKKQNAHLKDRIKYLEDRKNEVAVDFVKEPMNVHSSFRDREFAKERIHDKESSDETSKITKRSRDKRTGQKGFGESGNFETATKDKNEFKDKTGHNRIRQFSQGSTVAFFATRQSSHAEHLGAHQPIVFDRTVTNFGQGYHNTTGTFIAPVSGVYVFSTTIFARNEGAHFQFAVNDHPYTTMYAHSTEVYETLSQTIILSLSKGDDVAIQNLDSDKFVHGYNYSLFSGFLLAPTEGDVVVG